MADDLLSRIEYDPEAPDVESIMRQARALLGTQRPAGELGGAAFAASRGRDAARLDELRGAEAGVRGLQAAPYVAPSRVPLIGGLLDRVRLAFHRLVVFYVARLADAQGRFNRETVAALEGLAAGDADRIARLEGQVAALEARLKALEGAGATGMAETKRG